MVNNSVNVRQDSPVRIAGIDVGVVSGVSPAGNASRISFTVDDNGLPLHSDATVRIRTRLFLEGGYYPGQRGAHQPVELLPASDPVAAAEALTGCRGFRASVRPRAPGALGEGRLAAALEHAERWRERRPPNTVPLANHTIQGDPA